MTDYSNRRVMMVDTQVRPSDVTKFPIIAAMLAVARENFVPADKRETAYMSENIDLGRTSADGAAKLCQAFGRFGYSTC